MLNRIQTVFMEVRRPCPDCLGSGINCLQCAGSGSLPAVMEKKYILCTSGLLKKLSTDAI
uniref:Molecular chaperone DnaJ n=1 Tax=Klebsiella pneumoniae TaxID=573 RepID=A0A8B0SSW0_KLEPN|nr:hypothetical protein [Klebsiella pneumoniae]